MRCLAGPLLLVSLAACGTPTARPRAPAVADKHSLYGDPGLVPTRAGEHARRELALAGQVRAGLLLVRTIDDAAVDVSLQPDGTPARVTVTVRGDAPDADVRSLVRGVVGPIPDTEVHLIRSATPARPSPVGLDIPLALALLGLGVSLGITVERGRRRRGR